MPKLSCYQAISLSDRYQKKLTATQANYTTSDSEKLDEIGNFNRLAVNLD